MGERIAYDPGTSQDHGWWKCILCGFMDQAKTGPFWRVCPACESEAALFREALATVARDNKEGF
jgi:rubrerythrin